MTEHDELINLPLVRLMDQDGMSSWFNVSEISAIVPSGQVPDPELNASEQVTSELVPLSRVVLKSGSAAPVLGTPDEIVALLQSGTSGNLEVDENGYPKNLHYGADVEV
jgi:hypothetical protein